MPIPNLHSIQTADKKFETQTKPILMVCSDMNGYVCKYGTGIGFAKRLYCEYLSAQFLSRWQLPIPNFAFVTINPEHIPTHFNIAHTSFTQTGFGVQYNRSYNELTHLNTLNNVTAFKQPLIKQTFLKIALFDCWLANEDRNNNNYNLMFDIAYNNNLVVIDHEGIFNSRIFEQPIYSLNYNDSLLSSVFAQKLFSKKDFTNEFITDLETYFYLCLQNCEQDVNLILQNVPKNWEIDTELVVKKISEIFSESWKKETLTTFKNFIQTLVNTL